MDTYNSAVSRRKWIYTILRKTAHLPAYALKWVLVRALLKYKFWIFMTPRVFMLKERFRNYSDKLLRFFTHERYSFINNYIYCLRTLAGNACEECHLPESVTCVCYFWRLFIKINNLRIFVYKFWHIPYRLVIILYFQRGISNTSLKIHICISHSAQQ